MWLPKWWWGRPWGIFLDDVMGPAICDWRVVSAFDDFVKWFLHDEINISRDCKYFRFLDKWFYRFLMLLFDVMPMCRKDDVLRWCRLFQRWWCACRAHDDAVITPRLKYYAASADYRCDDLSTLMMIFSFLSWCRRRRLIIVETFLLSRKHYYYFISLVAEDELMITPPMSWWFSMWCDADAEHYFHVAELWLMPSRPSKWLFHITPPITMMMCRFLRRHEGHFDYRGCIDDYEERLITSRLRGADYDAKM